VRLLYLIYGLIVLFGATFYNLGSGSDYKSGGSGGSGRVRGGSSGGGSWSSGGGHK